jgi:hypothetical protein
MVPPTEDILPVARQRTWQGAVRAMAVMQILTAMAASVFFGVCFGPRSAAAASWGAAAAAANGLLLVWRWKRGAQASHSDAVRHLWSFFGSSVERLVAVAVLFALGMGYLHLPALPMIAGFVLGLLSMFAFQFLSATKFLQNV